MGRRSNSPTRPTRRAPLRLAGLDRGSRDRIMDFLFPPHLGPDDVQHYIRLRLVCREWRDRLDGPEMFGPNTIPLLRKATRHIAMREVLVEYQVHTFGRLIHHPDKGAATCVREIARFPLLWPLGETWKMGRPLGGYQLTGTKFIPCTYFFWRAELLHLHEVIGLPVIPEDDNEQ